jgi:CDGSH-type Zn-finger protein
MIDYAKIAIKGENYANTLLNNKALNWKFETVEETGEIDKNEGKYKRCVKICVYPSNLCTIGGSLHKLYEDGLHNYSQFTFSKLKATLNHYSDTFEIPLEEANLIQFEFGVNILMPYLPKKFLQKIVAYRHQLPSIDRNKSKKYLVRFENTDFEIKIYCKTSQYKLNEYVLRFEVKSKTKRFVKYQFQNLNDLMKIENYQLLGHILLSIFDELIVFETLNTNLLTKQQKKVYDTISNPILWDGLQSRNQRYEYKKIYNKLCAEFVKDSQKELVRNLIKCTWDNLLKN